VSATHEGSQRLRAVGFGLFASAGRTELVDLVEPVNWTASVKAVRLAGVCRTWISCEVDDVGLGADIAHAAGCSESTETIDRERFDALRLATAIRGCATFLSTMPSSSASSVVRLGWTVSAHGWRRMQIRSSSARTDVARPGRVPTRLVGCGGGVGVGGVRLRAAVTTRLDCPKKDFSGDSPVDYRPFLSVTRTARRRACSSKTESLRWRELRLARSPICLQCAQCS